MSSAVPSKRQQRPGTIPSGKGIASTIARFFDSTVGSKLLVAVTGILLTVYVVAHMLGNVLVFSGPARINDYAKFLKDLGPLLWLLRIGLLIAFVLHVVLAIRLKWRSAEARPIGYQYHQNIQASVASRTMLLTGLVILAFVLFHLAHFTFGWVKQAEATAATWSPSGEIIPTGQRVTTNYLNLVDAEGRHDVYSMVVAGFRSPVISIIYLIAQGCLLLHLAHGVSSVFQTLGWNSRDAQPYIKLFGWAIALLVVGGNVAIVIAVWAGWVPPVETYFVTSPRG
jgi:succinate dehydrogenase / fumarate reductase, cytochrome b subunit